ncbi:MAG: acyl carrier protein [Candidatus Omnitrophota bacterium]
MVAEKLKQIITESFGVKPEDIKNESSFVDDLGADSLDLVELTMSIEEAFNIEIPDEDAEQLDTVGKVIAYIESKVNKS